MKHIFTYTICTLLLISCATQKSRYELSTLGKIYHNTTARYNGYFNATVLLDESITALNQQQQDNYHELLPIYQYTAATNPGAVAQNLDEAIKKVSVVVTLHEQSQWVDDCYLLIGQAEYLKQDFEAAENAFEFFLDEFKPDGTRVNAKPSRKLQKAKRKASRNRRASRSNNRSKENIESQEDARDEERAKKTRKQLEKERKAYNKALKKKRRQAKRNAQKKRKRKAPPLKKEEERQDIVQPEDKSEDTSEQADSRKQADKKSDTPEAETKPDKPETSSQSAENPGGLRHKPAYQEVVLWLARTYTKRQNFIRAEYYLNLLARKASLRDDVYEALPLAFGEYFIAREMYQKAIPHLEEAIERAPKRDLKARYAFILGQLYQKTEDYPAAKKTFDQVVDYKPDYTMVFNAQIQALGSSMLGGMLSEGETLATLERMLKDDKNIDFADQIYYTLARLEYGKGDIDQAIAYLQLAVENGANNPIQLAESNYLLGNLYYEKQDYANAKIAYDATISSMPQEDPRYTPTKRLAENLTDIARHLETIALQDSLLRLSTLSEEELAVLAKEIKKQRDREAAIAAEAGAQPGDAFGKKGAGRNNAISPGQDAGIGIPVSARGSGSSKESSFFAYDPREIKRGKREFQSIWGDRRLGDNWRVSSIAQSNISFDEEESDPGVTSIPIATSEIEDIFKDVPSTDVEIEAAHTKIQEAMIGLGQLYREKLENYDASIEILEQLLDLYPETSHRLEALYQLYVSHTIKGEFNKAEQYKQEIIEKHSQSRYAKALKDPNYLKEQLSEEQKISKQYEEAYASFEAGDAVRAQEIINQSRQTYGTQHEMYPKFHLLFAMAVGQVEGREAYINELKQIIAQHPKTPEEVKARDILHLLGEVKDSRLTQGRDAEADFQLQENALHFVIVMIEDPQSISAQDAKISISDYHKKYHSLEKLRMSSLVFNPSSRSFIVLIRSFKNQAEAMRYYANYLKHKNEYLPEGVSFVLYPITQHNYREVIKLRSLDAYGYFFEDNY